MKEVTSVWKILSVLRKRACTIQGFEGRRGLQEWMKVHFRYWQGIEPRWGRQWLNVGKVMPDYKIKLRNLDGRVEHSPARDGRIDANLTQTCSGLQRVFLLVRTDTLESHLFQYRNQLHRKSCRSAKSEAKQRELEVLRGGAKDSSP